MKKIFTLGIVFCLAVFNSCSSNDNDNIETPVVINKTIPPELTGSWKINYATLANDADYNWGNSFGAYIKFNSDNSIEYKDGNKFAGVNTVNIVKDVKQISGNLSNSLTIGINNIPNSITCRYSGHHPGQVEFTISYNSKSGFYDMILTGTKQ